MIRALVDWYHRTVLHCSQDWLDDCRHYRGAVLTGRLAHWCPEWDGLPIDETCEEWPCCGFDGTDDSDMDPAALSLKL